MRTRTLLRPKMPPTRLRQARLLAREILAIHSESLPPCARRAAVSEARLTSTGVAVIVMAPLGEPPCAVIKMPVSPGAGSGLERESAVLTALHTDDRLDGWRALLPRPQAQGVIKGQHYRLDLALRGDPIPHRAQDARQYRSALVLAAETIAVLHEATATTVVGDDQLQEAWVDRHLRALGRHSIRSGPLTRGLRRLGDELRETLVGRTFSVSWIHGDYWLGNLLFATSGAAPDTISGIVDWESAADRELPCHDLLHLLLYTRRLLSGRELGDIVREQLRSGEWSADERRLLRRHAAWRQDRSLSDRSLLLLYWLRHAAMHARQQSWPVGYRYAVWERRNVLPVLASL